MFVAMVNQVGGNDSLIFDGNSFVLRPGRECRPGRRFEEDLLVVDLPGRAEANPQLPCHAARRHRRGLSALVLARATTSASAASSACFVGLSGGIDSALVAAIAVDALGAENVLGVLMPSEYSSPARWMIPSNSPQSRHQD